jgi:hypothetical protein
LALHRQSELIRMQATYHERPASNADSWLAALDAIKAQLGASGTRNVFWSCDSDRGLVQLGFNERLNLIQPLRPFEINRMVFMHN